jgi:hypothetical protein
MKKYAVIIGNNHIDSDRVINALKDAGFEMLIDAGGDIYKILTINECQCGIVGVMLSMHSIRFSECEFEILFPEDVIRYAKELDGAKPKAVKMTVAQICEALGKNIEIVKD